MVRYFIIDSRVILGFVEVPRTTDLSNMDTNEQSATPNHNEIGDADKAPSVIIVIRDSTGKYSWTSNMRYKNETFEAKKPQALLPQQNSEKWDPTLHSQSAPVSLIHADASPISFYDY